MPASLMRLAAHPPEAPDPTTTKSTATRYLEFLRSSSAKAIFERYGFSYLIKPTSYRGQYLLLALSGH